jgi:hypothetical protein
MERNVARKKRESYLLVEQSFTHWARGSRDGRHGLGGFVGHGG